MNTHQNTHQNTHEYTSEMYESDTEHILVTRDSLCLFTSDQALIKARANYFIINK